jgi:hypothetical protein
MNPNEDNSSSVAQNDGTDTDNNSSTAQAQNNGTDTGNNGKESDKAQGIYDLIKSAAMIETAIAHILNAEGEKIQKAIEATNDVKDLIEVNRSVNKVLANATQLEQTLYQRLDAARDLYEFAQSASPYVPDTPGNYASDNGTQSALCRNNCCNRCCNNCRRCWNCQCRCVNNVICQCRTGILLSKFSRRTLTKRD